MYSTALALTATLLLLPGVTAEPNYPRTPHPTDPRAVAAFAHAEAEVAAESRRQANQVAVAAMLKAARQIEERQAQEVIARPAPHCLEDLDEAQAKARRLGKPLVIWVGMTCDDEPAIRDALDGCGSVGCHQSTYNGSSRPRIVIPGRVITAFPKDLIQQYTPEQIAACARTGECPCPSGACPAACAPAVQYSSGTSCQGGNCGRR